MTHHNTYKIDVPGGVMQPDLDQIPGSNRDNYAARHWVSISRGDYGVVWSSVDAPVVQLGESKPTSIYPGSPWRNTTGWPAGGSIPS